MAVTALNKRAMVAAAIVAAAGVLGACSGHVEVSASTAPSTPTSESPAPAVAKEQLAVVVKQRLEEKVGAPADSVVCDGDLPAQVGAEQQCILTDGDRRYRVHVTAKAVNGGKVNFGIETDPHPIDAADSSGDVTEAG